MEHPRRPRTSFIIFAENHRSMFRELYPSMTYIDALKHMKEKYDQLTEEEKEYYKQMAIDDHARYLAECATVGH